MDDYETFLDRALKQAPAVKTADTRFVVPIPKLFSEGRATVLENFGDIIDVLRRDSAHFMKYMLRELGTAGKIEGRRATFQGRFSSDAIKSHVDNYVREYVICSECGRPDTHLIKSDRVLILKCDACGGHRPIAKRKVQKEAPKEAVQEGNVYELKIEAVGRKGDGIAKLDRYTIFIPNVNKGDIVKAKVNKVSGTLAFADLVERVS